MLRQEGAGRKIVRPKDGVEPVLAKGTCTLRCKDACCMEKGARRKHPVIQSDSVLLQHAVDGAQEICERARHSDCGRHSDFCCARQCRRVGEPAVVPDGQKDVAPKSMCWCSSRLF